MFVKVVATQQGIWEKILRFFEWPKEKRSLRSPANALGKALLYAKGNQSTRRVALKPKEVVRIYDFEENIKIRKAGSKCFRKHQIISKESKCSKIKW